ncbi:type II toxin-antitoxin system VapC family toxin [soil metagenome]
MQGVLVDTNIILDIFTADPHWFEWSNKMLHSYGNQTTLCINKIIYAEVSVGFKRIEELEELLPKDVFLRMSIPWEAAFLAGKAYLKYKMNGGQKASVLSDFFIGAHAAIADLALLTRDGHRFKHYFPQLQIIQPTHSH